MKCLILGSTGQLGIRVQSQLKAKGWTTIPASRNVADLSNREEVTRLIRRTSPDWVVNCAAYTQVDKAESEPEPAFRVNREGTRNAAEAAKQANAGFVHISTDFVFDGTKSAPYAETDGTNPLNVYGKSKLEGETAALSANPETLLVRTSWLFGKEGHNFVKTMLHLGKERPAIKVVDDQIGAPTCCSDLAWALGELMEKQAKGVFHFTNEGVASWYDLAVAVYEEGRGLGLSFKARLPEPVPANDYPRPAPRPSFSVLSKCKIRPLLPMPIRHWRESLRDVLKEIQS